MSKNSINSACNVVNFQSESNEPVPDSDLLIDIISDVQSCDHSDTDYRKYYLTNEYDFEQDIEKLIAVSKQFQKEYENESSVNLDNVSIEDAKRNLNIQILTTSSNSLISRLTPDHQANQPNDVDNYYFTSSRFKKENIFSMRSRGRSNKAFTPKLPHPGPFGTGIIRPLPKKHSCVQKSEVSSIKRSHSVALHIRPYSTRYYDFGRTHPHLELVKSGDTMVPKRIFKGTSQSDERTSKTTMKEPLLNKGITWHEFFERSNVYSSKSLQSSHVDELTHATSVQTVPSQSFSPSLNNTKMQKHTLPQLNIRAECCVQPIPPISIAPNGCKQFINSNIKLVEIIYEDSESAVKSIESPVKENVDFLLDDGKINEQILNQGDLEYIPTIEVNQNTEITESQISFSSPTKTSSSNHGYHNSFEESISLSQVSSDHEAPQSLVPESSIPRKRKKFVKNRKDTNMQAAIITSSDYSDFEYDNQQTCQPQPGSHGNAINIKLPSFPTNELMQMVDEIFDTSSDRNENNRTRHKHVVIERSVQTDFVWENINEILKQHRAAAIEPISDLMSNNFPSFVGRPVKTVVLNEPQNLETLQTNDTCKNQCTNDKMVNREIINSAPIECSHSDADIFINRVNRDELEGYCSHAYMKRFKICSCLTCKSNIKFSVMNVRHSTQSQYITSSTSSSSPAVETSKQKTTSTNNLHPSERYKRMKQAQREHFENDPRISKTLKNIYEAAKRVKLQNEQNSSSSSSSRDLMGEILYSTNFSDLLQNESLQPDLYTASDEELLFGLHNTDEFPFPYSSHLLKTESSQDTSTSNGRFCGLGKSTEVLYKNKLMCTNSEDSSNNSFYNKRGSDLERYLLKDIENSWSDPAVLSSMYSTSSLERKINEIQLDNKSFN